MGEVHGMAQQPGEDAEIGRGAVAFEAQQRANRLSRRNLPRDPTDRLGGCGDILVDQRAIEPQQHGAHVLQLAADTCLRNGKRAAGIAMRAILLAAQQRIFRHWRREPAAKLAVQRKETDLDPHIQQRMQRRCSERYIPRDDDLRDFEKRDFHRALILILDNQVIVAFFHDRLLFT